MNDYIIGLFKKTLNFPRTQIVEFLINGKINYILNEIEKINNPKLLN